ncbi:acyltransferase [Novosphingobium sp. SL115]|uniref:acyltransferase n=1 Tax=Novosphingobium sp. SL115 TaxID=2995150 RepID=UPI002DD44300|nr:DapH/DapD/GlmU-related protein [Novosphingobium sp. SL115]
MPASPSRSPLRKSFRQHLQRFVQTRFWRMDIHPTAWIATTALIDRTWPKGVHIGAGCVIDHQAVVLTHDMTRGLYLDTRIGEGTRIAPRAIILPGVTIGRNCIVEAGSVVNRDVPDDTRVIGSPAREAA